MRKSTKKQCPKCLRNITLNVFNLHYNNCSPKFCPCGKLLKKRRKFCSNSCCAKFATKETKQKRLNTIRKKVKLRGFYHSEETKQKIRKSHIGMKYSEEFGNKIRKSLTGRKLSELHKQNITIGINNSEKFSNVNWSRLRKVQWDTGKSTGMRGKHHSAEHNKKMRIYMLNYIEKTKGKPFAFVGTHEQQMLDEQEQKDNCKILRQYLIKELGYIVDGYCPETNTVYEVYEKHHEKVIDHDKQRQKEIENHLCCKFIVIWDLTVSGRKRSF